ncbi:MAG: hypothetical protein UHD64_08020 [Bacteroidales bacterium]|nr:hypothetical protein [Bacteroidales bacterium]
MANTKKTKVQTEEVIENEIVEEVEEVVKPAPKKVNKPKHDPNELISCRSVRFGELRLIGPKTHFPYSWANEGDIRDVEYQDLVSWRALHSRYLFEPMIIIEDEDLVEEWKADLGSLYDNLQQIDLKEMFKLPHRQFVAQLKKLPDGMKSTVQNMAYSMIQNRTLYDLRTIDAIDEILGTELKMMI